MTELLLWLAMEAPREADLPAHTLGPRGLPHVLICPDSLYAMGIAQGYNVARFNTPQVITMLDASAQARLRWKEPRGEKHAQPDHSHSFQHEYTGARHAVFVVALENQHTVPPVGAFIRWETPSLWA